MYHKEYSGKRALVRYRGGIVGEKPFEDFTEGDPEVILVGGGFVPRGVEELIYSMNIGEQKQAVISCDKAYGAHDPEGVQRYTRSFVRNGYSLQEGDVFAWKHPVSLKEVPVRCVEANEHTVTVDFNHPLAGKDLEYWFELIDVIDDSGASLSQKLTS